MNSIKKEDFIYENKNSLTKELCEDLLCRFENKTEIEISNKYGKLRVYLINELFTNLNKLKNKYENLIGMNMLNIIYNKSQIQFTLKEYCNNEEIIIINRLGNINNNNVNKLTFIWFLNDCDGDLVFWNNHKIKMSIGKLVVFPFSWCFP
jgi:hypothetical protein